LCFFEFFEFFQKILPLEKMSRVARKAAAGGTKEKENNSSVVVIDMDTKKKKPESPHWKARTHSLSAKDAQQLSVEQFLRQECETTVAQVMAHAEARIRQFEFEADIVRREMQTAINGK
jgi:hypothetical protein